MTIDWLSFFIGLAAGVFFMNLVTLISAYIRLKGASARVDAHMERLENYKAQIEKKKEEILGEKK